MIPDPTRDPCPHLVIPESGVTYPDVLTFVDAGGDIITAAFVPDHSARNYLTYRVTQREGLHRGHMESCSAPSGDVRAHGDIPHVGAFLYSDMSVGSMTPNNGETRTPYDYPHTQRGFLAALNKAINN